MPFSDKPDETAASLWEISPAGIYGNHSLVGESLVDCGITRRVHSRKPNVHQIKVVTKAGFGQVLYKVSTHHVHLQQTKQVAAVLP